MRIDDNDTMNLKKFAHAKDIEHARPSALEPDVATKHCTTDCPVMGHRSQIEPVEHTVSSTDLAEHFKFAFNNEQVACDIAEEETTFQDCTKKEIFQIQPLRK